MGILGRCCVKCFTAMHGLPSRVGLIIILILQAAILDYFVVAYETPSAMAWFAADIVNIILVVGSFIFSHRLHTFWRRGQSTGHGISMVWLVWLVSAATVGGRMLVTFKHLVTQLKEDSFWGQNTLKTGVALTACTFVLLLAAHHDSATGSERRRYIEELTGTVVFDLLDTVDVLEVLVEPEDRQVLWEGLEEAILAVAFINLLIPTVPLLTLSLTHFGRTKVSRRLVVIHKVMVAMVVNVPNLVLRMLLWHGFSVGISPFILKNIILIALTLYELFEHQVEVEFRHDEEAAAKERNGVELTTPSPAGDTARADQDTEDSNMQRTASFAVEERV